MERKPMISDCPNSTWKADRSKLSTSLAEMLWEAQIEPSHRRNLTTLQRSFLAAHLRALRRETSPALPPSVVVEPIKSAVLETCTSTEQFLLKSENARLLTNSVMRWITLRIQKRAFPQELALMITKRTFLMTSTGKSTTTWPLLMMLPEAKQGRRATE